MNKTTTLTYEHILVKIDGEELDQKMLRTLKFEQKINDHARLRITGIVPNDKKDRYIDLADERSGVIVDCIEAGDITHLFNGVMTNIEIRMVRDIYYFDIEAASHTFEMDIQLKKRSFQDNEMTYEALVKKIISEYNGSDVIETVTNETVLDKPVVQYLETDWEFIKRLASHFNAGLVPEAAVDKPKFWFGIPQEREAGEYKEVFFSVKKQIGVYRDSAANYIPGITENDFLYYELVVGQLMRIGDHVSLNGRSLYVAGTTLSIEDGILRNTCVLTPKNGLKQNLILHPHITGATLMGQVIDVEHDAVRVHLQIDREQDKNKAYWFSYATSYTTEGNTGWYCMPELEDTVSLYFPTNKEEDAVVINSIRQKTKGGDKIEDPRIKYFRTKHGKEIMFSQNQILISGKDGEILIRLDEETGIEIYSEKEVKITSKNDMRLDVGKKISVTAGDEIDIQCNSSGITMNGTTYLKGNQVKLN
jgi:hypothetical protein